MHNTLVWVLEHTQYMTVTHCTLCVYIHLYIIVCVLCYSSIMLWIAGVLVEASVKMVPTKVCGPHSGWEMHLQQPRSRISNPKYRNRSSVSNNVACEYGL